MEINWDGAIQELQRRGRDGGQYLNPSTGKVCVLGAAMLAQGMAQHEVEGNMNANDPCALRAAAELAPIVRENFSERSRTTFKDDWLAVTYFNDDDRTTTDEVIAVLEKARANATPTWTADGV